MINIFAFLISKKIIYTILILVVGYFLYKILSNVINKSFNLRMRLMKVDNRRQRTINAIIHNVLKYTFVVIVFFSLLGVFGVNAGAIVASIAVIGLAIGLVVQDILKDILAGTFILIENQYAIGDIVMIGNFKGEVIFLGLKSTKLRSATGEIKILSNRNISDITNYSLNNSTLYIDVDLAYDNDDTLVDKTLSSLATKLSKKIKNCKSDFQYLGIEKLGDKTTYRFSVEADIKYQEDIRRETLSEIKKAINGTDIRR
ncbi:MAG: mechanosensitive ion channel family protein [Bacilli bacterium]|nr:mechanosensitive ion channel family protein [Bacilli bacterium]MDD4411230.1 mechanosensitive ion channel family protein [Bacilli bacterium]